MLQVLLMEIKIGWLKRKVHLYLSEGHGRGLLGAGGRRCCWRQAGLNQIGMSISLSIYLSVDLSRCLANYLSIRGRTQKGGGRILRKIYSFYEILNKMSQKGEGGKGPPSPICPSTFLSVCLSICQSICLSIYPSVYLSIHSSICVSVCLCLTVCLSILPSF